MGNTNNPAAPNTYTPPFTAFADVTASRTGGTTYQNTTGKPLLVSICLNTTGAGIGLVRMDSTTPALTVRIRVGEATGIATKDQVFFIVPKDWYYEAEVSAGTITYWLEYS